MEAWWTEVEAEEWSDAIVASMKLGGVDQLFFVSGSELAFYQEAVAKAKRKGRPAPDLITVTHEGVALNAALGNAMVRNAPSATAVHVDAGTLNQGAGIHAAWRGNYPVLMTAGAGPRAYPGTLRGSRNGVIQWLQEPRDQGEIVRQYTKMDHRMSHDDNPGLMVSRLLQIALSEPAGPVYLTVPREAAMLELDGVARFPTVSQLGVARPVCPDPADVKDIARWLVAAENPVVFTTGAGREEEAFDELLALVELLALPVVESGHADRLNFPSTHWAAGTGPSAAEADVILVLEDIVPWIPGGSSPREGTRIAWVSIDPVYSRYKTMEFQADLWIPASVAGTARAIREAAATLLNASDRERITARRARLSERKAALDATEEARAEADLKAGGLTGRLVGRELGALLEPDAIVLNDAVSNQGPVRHFARRERYGTYFRSGSSAGGWSSGAAFGIKLAHPERDVVAASGDGYLMFGSPLSALWAASHHKAAYLTVVFVNGSYSTGTTGLKESYPDGFAVSEGDYDGGTFWPPPRFDKLAEAANAYGERVSTLEQLAPALKRGLAETRDGVPALIAVDVPGPVPHS